MARKSKTKVIGDHSYTVTALGARVGAEGLRRLGAIAGPALASTLARVGTGGLDANMPVVLGGVAGILSQLGADDFNWFCTEFGKSSKVLMHGKVDVDVHSQFDELFVDNYLEMVEWFTLSLEVNYGAFLKGAFAKFTAAMVAADAPKAE